MLYTSNVCVTWSMQKHSSAGRPGVTASNANICETKISVWAAFQIVGQM